MNHSSSRPGLLPSLGLIGVSFVVCALVVVADVGIWNTPYETTDRAGRGMGFNDPLSGEHWGILFSNFRFRGLLAPGYAYAWLLLVMHGVGVGLLVRGEGVRRRPVRWFFGLQGVLFPVGWLGFLVLPMMVRALLNGTFDRESMIDVPFVAITAQPIWIATSLAILGIGWFTRTAVPRRDRAADVA